MLRRHMPKKIHLDSVIKPNGSVWYTLIFESSQSFYVEERTDSNLPFLKNQVTHIAPTDFYKHTINGTSLRKLVAARLEDLVHSQTVDRPQPD